MKNVFGDATVPITSREQLLHDLSDFRIFSFPEQDFFIDNNLHIMIRNL